MRKQTTILALISLGPVAAACGGGSSSAGAGGSATSDASATAAVTTGTNTGGAAPSNIQHVVIVVQENHTFDTYFGNYCTAPTGSNPTCNAGPSCCEAGPAMDPSGASPTVLDDASNGGFDPNHAQACELAEMNGGKMDKFVTGAACSDPRNFAYASPAALKTYRDLASQYAIADRYFQPIAGQSSSNDMYFAVADYVFTDNAFCPDTIGKQCDFAPKMEYSGKQTVADLLLAAGHTFAVYAEGYAVMQAHDPMSCPAAPADCPAKTPIYPCNYDPSDIPFEYYAQLADDPNTMKDYAAFATDLAAGQLPSVSFVKGLGYRSEHPGGGTTITDGESFVSGVIEAVQASSAKDDTLVLIAWDEGGGFFDHVAPPPASTVDMKPYGTRLPLLAVGRFAKKNHVSHVEMEHSSIVKFIEYNFLGAVGQLQARDAVVANLGDLLDPTQTGIPIPSD